MNTADQLTLFDLLAGEPTSGGRFTQAQKLSFLNEGRKWFCEETKSFQLRDSQQTVAGTKLYSVPNDVIWFYEMEWDGIPLRTIRPQDWRFEIGDDQELKGIPAVYKYFARQIQLYPVPDSVKTLRYEGWGYASDLTLAGSDVDFTDQQARGSIWRAVWVAKEADERDADREKAQALGIMLEFRKQYKQKGPRHVRPEGPRRSLLGRILRG